MPTTKAQHEAIACLSIAASIFADCKLETVDMTDENAQPTTGAAFIERLRAASVNLKAECEAPANSGHVIRRASSAMGKTRSTLGVRPVTSAEKGSDIQTDTVGVGSVVIGPFDNHFEIKGLSSAKKSSIIDLPTISADGRRVEGVTTLNAHFLNWSDAEYHAFLSIAKRGESYVCETIDAEGGWEGVTAPVAPSIDGDADVD